ncbi:MAG TPA: hypothetical protein VHV32_02840 [Candidatus Angelobacter sp.]|jgi:hypothetical protein|nr:hypothetical protein [Candidatus Angelobacter sp.]
MWDRICRFTSHRYSAFVLVEDRSAPDESRSARGRPRGVCQWTKFAAEQGSLDTTFTLLPVSAFLFLRQAARRVVGLAADDVISVIGVHQLKICTHQRSSAAKDYLSIS